MATFVWDMAPRRYNLLMTWKLAQLLQQKEQKVYYVYYKDADFMLELLKKRLNCSVIYPDDFRWLRPDLVLLDCPPPLSGLRADAESGVSHQVVAAVRLDEMAETALGQSEGVDKVRDHPTFPMKMKKDTSFHRNSLHSCHQGTTRWNRKHNGWQESCNRPSGPYTAATDTL